MTFDHAEQAVLARLADVLIPAGDGLPSASAAGVADDGLDRVLAARPDLADDLKTLLLKARGCDAIDFVTRLRTNDANSFGLLAELTAGAYFLNPTVQQAIEYRGQIPKRIDPHPDYLDDGLLDAVVRRGPIYRPTPSP